MPLHYNTITFHQLTKDYSPVYLYYISHTNTPNLASPKYTFSAITPNNHRKIEEHVQFDERVRRSITSVEN